MSENLIVCTLWLEMSAFCPEPSADILPCGKISGCSQHFLSARFRWCPAELLDFWSTLWKSLPPMPLTLDFGCHCRSKASPSQALFSHRGAAVLLIWLNSLFVTENIVNPSLYKPLKSSSHPGNITAFIN